MKSENKMKIINLRNIKNKKIIFYYCLGCIEVFFISFLFYKVLYKDKENLK